MTAALRRPCLTCGVPVRGASRCRACAIPRPSTAARGYGNGWAEVLLAVLERDRYRCQWCGVAADTVDHLVPLARGGARLDPANLAAACLRCNSRRGGTRFFGGDHRGLIPSPRFSLYCPETNEPPQWKDPK